MKYLLLLVSLCIGGSIKATDYYFSSSNGDDSRSAIEAQNPSTPWKTISKLNIISGTLNAGDRVLFQRGDVFYGSITMGKSGTVANPIIFGAFGSGARPVISGFITVDSWTSISSNIWESTAAVSTLNSCNIISINGANAAQGRTPDAGYWTIGGTNGNSITDAENLEASVTDWAGAQVVLRKYRWIMDKYTITSASGNSINFTNGGDAIQTGWGYFIQNDVRTLTLQNEWCYNASTKKIAIYSTSTPVNVSVPTVDVAVNMNSKDYITFDNINFTGFNSTGINTTSRTGITIQNCDFSYIGVNAIYGYPNSYSLKVTGSTFTDINSRGIHAGSSSNAIIRGNTLRNIGHYAGMGSNGDDSYTAIISHGDDGEVSYNSITNAGYVGIRWDGHGTVIKNNFVNTTNYIKDDGGGIYCYPNQLGPVAQSFTQRTVRDNIVINSIGAIAGGTPSSNASEGMGIYADGTSPNIDFINNTIANCRLGLFLNNSHEVNVTGNTIYDCARGLYLIKYGSVPISNVSINDNIFVAKTTNQYSAYYEPGAATMPADFFADNNTYARPLDDNTTIWRDQNGTNYYNTLEQWKNYTGQEANSSKSTATIASVNELRFEYNPESVSQTISLGATYIDMKGVIYNGSITIAPFSSSILLKTSAGNIAPTANAGADQTITIPANSISISGTGNDPDGTITGYQWRKVSGPASGNILNNTNASTTVTGLSQGIYNFELKVTDNNGATDVDTMVVTVNAGNNQAPVANAGQDQTILLPLNNVTLTGSGNDTDGTVVSYTWSKISGPSAGIISLPASAITGVSGLVQGLYQFQLTVTDNNGATASDIMQVTVNNSGINTPFSGSAQLIPGTIEFENFDLGGQDIAYNDITPENTGGVYRITEAVDIENSTDGSPNIGWTEAGEWMKYSVQVTTAGTYNITARVSSQNTATSFRVEMDGTTIATFSVPNTGGYQNWQNVLIPGITLSAGLKVMRVFYITGGYNLNNITFAVAPPPNQLPAANAGADQNITLPTNTASLTGSGNDPDGTISSYLWRKISGPTAGTITNTNSAATTATALVQGTYKFELKVTDNSGATDLDTMQVTVNAAIPPPNQLPTANAGLDQNITLPTNTASLNGSGNDPDGTISAYLWRKISGPATGVISNPNSAATTATALVQGTYKFELKVTDNSGATDLDTMQVTVNAAIPPPNQLPTANAGLDQNITLPTNTASLNGSGNDPDGTITAYLWRKISGPTAGTITNVNSAATTATALVQGTYKFELKVTDNSGATDLDTMQVTVNAAIPPPNQLPTANAGLDQNITLPTNTATLNGSGNDPDGTISNYLWRKISGPTAGTITNPNSAATTATALVQGTYKFEMKVTDNSGATDLDTMQVTVNAAIPPPNQLPTANAGLDQNITLPTNTASLNGSGNDPDGTISAYLWRKISGPATGVISNPNSAATTATALVQGTYKFELKVTDNSGATDLDTMQVTVNAAIPPPNQLPTANAGLDQNITLPTNTASLNGSGNDPDGTITAYLWRKISGPTAGTITNVNSAATTATALVQGTYKFELKVTDNSGATDLDTMQVTVNAAIPPPNQLPTANAGLDQNITLPNNTASLNGSGNDPDGTITAYLWRKISGPSAGTITNPNSAATTATALVQGTYKFELKVTDNSGATDLDTMQVTVNEAIVIANSLPVADAGSDTTIYLPTNTISITGMGTDTDGMISGYNWRVINGSSFVITNAYQATTYLYDLQPGVYRMELTVTDNRGATGKDTVTVNVVDNSTQDTPEDGLVILGNPVVTNALHAKISSGTVNNRKITAVLTDMQGRVLCKKMITVTRHIFTETIDMTGFLSGQYVLSVYFENKKPHSVPFIKLR